MKNVFIKFKSRRSTKNNTLSCTKFFLNCSNFKMWIIKIPLNHKIYFIICIFKIGNEKQFYLYNLYQYKTHLLFNIKFSLKMGMFIL